METAQDTKHAQQDVLRRMLQIQEQERVKIARILHDQVGQNLTAIQLHLRRFRTERAENIPQIVEALAKMADALGKEIHELSFQLRPTSVDDLGLKRALRNHLEQWSTNSGIPVQSSIQLPDTTRIPPNVAATVFLIVQEALANVTRHARATNVSVFLKCHGDALVAIVEDDGGNFDAESDATTLDAQLGFDGMRERAALIDAELTVESCGPGGTSVHLRAPLKALDPMIHAYPHD